MERGRGGRSDKDPDNSDWGDGGKEGVRKEGRKEGREEERFLERRG